MVKSGIMNRWVKSLYINDIKHPIVTGWHYKIFDSKPYNDMEELTMNITGNRFTIGGHCDSKEWSQCIFEGYDGRKVSLQQIYNIYCLDLVKEHFGDIQDAWLKVYDNLYCKIYTKENNYREFKFLIDTSKIIFNNHVSYSYDYVV